MPDSVTGDESSPLLCHLSPSEPVFLACRAPCVSFSPLSSPPLFSTHPSLAVSKYRGSQTWALCQHVQIYYQAASKGRGQAPVSRHGAGRWGCRTCVRCCPFPQSTHQCPYAAAEVSETWPGSSAIISMSFRPFKRTFSSSLLFLVALPGSKGRMGLIVRTKRSPKTSVSWERSLAAGQRPLPLLDRSLPVSQAHGTADGGLLPHACGDSVD